MTPTYYALLGIAPTASAEEIRRAFRREIARYHPDKVEHLGQEFQSMAAVRSAALTQAYKTLTDETLRTAYDTETSVVPAEPDASSRAESITSEIRTDVSDHLRRAAVIRFRHAVHAEFGPCEEARVEGFELVCAPPRRRFWSELPPRMYARFVQYVDKVALSDSLNMVSRAPASVDAREPCVFVLGQHVAPPGELGPAIDRERRKAMSGGLGLTIVPVNTRSWSAHVHAGAPLVVKSLIARLEPS
jgi:hypothetical protein